MLAVVGGGKGAKMEQEFDSKLRIQDESSNNGGRGGSGGGGGGGGGNGGVQRGKSFQFRAPQENFTIEDFELGKIYGVGSYSKVGILVLFSSIFFYYYFWFLYCVLLIVSCIFYNQFMGFHKISV